MKTKHTKRTKYMHHTQLKTTEAKKERDHINKEILKVNKGL